MGHFVFQQNICSFKQHQPIIVGSQSDAFINADAWMPSVNMPFAASERATGCEYEL